MVVKIYDSFVFCLILLCEMLLILWSCLSMALNPLLCFAASINAFYTVCSSIFLAKANTCSLVIFTCFKLWLIPI